MNHLPLPNDTRREKTMQRSHVAVLPAYQFLNYKILFMKSMVLKAIIATVSILLAFLFLTPKGYAQGTMGRWEMCGLSGTTTGSVNPTGVVSGNVTFSALSRGAGLTAASASNGYSSSSWNTASALDISQNEYYEFTITPAPGYKMSISALKIRDIVSSVTSTFDAYVRYSDDGYASNLSTWAASTSATNHTVTLSANTAFQNRATAVTFRIYGSDAQNGTTTYRLDCAGTTAGLFRGVDVDGTVAQIAYASQFISMSTGSTSWCKSDVRNVTVTVKNVGSATWTSTAPGMNIGLKWNEDADYGAAPSNIPRVSVEAGVPAGPVAPGSTVTYTFPNVPSSQIAGSNKLTFDVVKEGDCWFGGNSGSCGPGNAAFASATQTILNNPTITRTSVSGTDAQTKCINTAITNITYAVANGTSASITAGALPTGVTGVFSAGVFTISGTPSVAGTFNYTVTTVSTCATNVSASGTITVTPVSTISLSSGAGSNTPTLCINNALTPITYAVGGSATGASITAGALPAGVTGAYSAGVFTISGTPTASGTFNYTVTTAGPCTNPSLTGTITVQANSIITRTSGSGTDAQTKCINTAIANITYGITAGGTGASITAGALPTGVTGSFSAGVFTIQGTPSVAGTFSYTVTTTGPCVNNSLSGTITVTGASTLTLSSATGTNTQTVCINNAITDITYATGGTATGASITAGALPAGVTGTFSAGVFTITGTPTASGTFNYTVTAAGPCPGPSLTGTITVQANSIITRTSGPGTDAQTKCINTAIANITYGITGGGTGASITAGALPTGVTGAFSAGVFTIQGTASVAGTFNYTVTTTGPCVNNSLSGTITVTAASSINITSAVGSNNQTVCINNPIGNITYQTSGTSTGASASGLPAGVTGVFDGINTFTISGTPTASGTFNYTVTTAGPCPQTATGTILVNNNSGIARTSASGTDAQTKCINTAITNITYSVTAGGTGASITAGALPAGVTGVYSAGVFTISGTPTASGTFNYTVTTTGPCINPSLSGTITVTPNATLTLTSAAGTTSQSVCSSSAITNITYSVGGGGTGAGVTGLPAGVTGSFSAGVFTISGTPTVAGTYSYTVTATGPCVNPSLSGTMTVNIIPTGVSVTPPTATICVGSNQLLTGAGTLAATTPINDNFNGATSVFAEGGTSSGDRAQIFTTNTSGSSVLSVATFTNGTGNIEVSTVANSNSLASSASVATTLTSAAISTIGTTLSTLTFNHTYKQGNSGSPSGLVQVSTNGGSSWATLATYTTNQGTSTGFVPVSINMSAYNGLASVMIRFNFNSAIANFFSNNTAWWAVDDVVLNGQQLTAFAWTANTGVGINGLPGNVTTQNITVNPTQTTTYTLAVRSQATNCAVSANSTVTVNQNSTIGLTSAVGTNAQTVCINNPITNITYAIGGGGTGASITAGALPAGVTGSFNAGVFTIQGTPTASGTFNYTVTTTGPCVNNSLSGTITVSANSSIALSSAGGTDAQTVCLNTPITNITYAIGGGGTGASITAGALPAGLTGSYSAGVFTISGTPTVSGSFSYTVTTAGPCVNNSLSGTIDVTANATISFTSAAGTDAQTLCINNAIADITYAIGGTGTGASASGLPAGVTGSYNAGVFTISGTATASGTFNYTVTTTGPCANPSLGGTITVTANSSITLSSATGTDAQAVCANNPIINVTYAIGGGGTGASITAGALPSGVTGSYSAGVFTISGTPTVNGNYNYTITTTGPCVNNVASGSILVTANATLQLTSGPGTNNQSACNNSPITPITFLAGSGATGASVTGGALPAGVTGVFNAGVFTISGTPTASGTFNYTITTTGGTCGQATASGTITVNVPPTATYVSTNVSACINNNGSITVTPSGNGPFNYAWSGVIGSGNPATTPYPNPGNVSAVSGLTIGFYNVTVSDANGCSVSMNNIHVQYAYFVYVTNNGGVSSPCSNTGSIILYGNAGVQPYTYALDAGAYQSSNTFTNLAPGTYIGHVKDASGCVSDKSIVVGTAPTLVIAPFVRNATSCAADGSIEIYRSGGIGPYTYSIDGTNYFTTNVFTNLPAGPYTCYVKDSKGCMSSQNVTIQQGAALTVSAAKTNTSTCVDDGTIQVIASGGTAPYSYSKDNGVTYQSGNSFSGLAQGNYQIKVKDFKGCTGIVNVSINYNIINVTSSVTNATACEATNGKIQLFRTGGVGPYTYSIDGNSYFASNVFAGLPPGSYDGYVMDSKSCIGVLGGIIVGPECGSFTRGVAPSSTGTRADKGITLSEKSVLKVSAYPNPATDAFSIQLQSNSKEKVKITVTDLLGRKVFQAEGNATQIYKFGNDLKPGMYLLQAVQGTEKQSIKLVKE
jgi:hypothetical protein